MPYAYREGLFSKRESQLKNLKFELRPVASNLRMKRRVGAKSKGMPKSSRSAAAPAKTRNDKTTLTVREFIEIWEKEAKEEI